MSSRMVATPRFTDAASLSAQGSSISYETSSTGRGASKSISITSVPLLAPPTRTTPVLKSTSTPSQHGPPPPSPLTMLRVKPSRTRSQVMSSPRRLPGSVDGFMLRRPSLPPASVYMRQAERHRSWSATLSNSGRGQRPNFVSSLSTASTSAFSSTQRVTTETKLGKTPTTPTTKFNRRTVTLPLLRRPSVDASKGINTSNNNENNSRSAGEKRQADMSPRQSASREEHQLDTVGAEPGEIKAGKSPAAAAPADKPWLSRPEGRGILRRCSPSPHLRAGVFLVTSTPTARSRSLSSTVSPPSSTTGFTAGGEQSLRLSRHVRFDDASIQYLNASARHAIYRDSQLGVHLNSVEWATIMMSPEAALGCSAARRVDSGTAMSMGKAKSGAWGADSEWFNAEFGAQMEPHADHSDLPLPTLLHCSSDSASSTPLLSIEESTSLGAETVHNCDTAEAACTLPSSCFADCASKRSKSTSKAATSRKASKRSVTQLRWPPTPLVYPHDAVAEKNSEDEARGSLPVPIYERDLLSTIAGPRTSSLWSTLALGGVNSLSRTVPSSWDSANDSPVTAPSLSSGAPRQRTSSALVSRPTIPSSQDTTTTNAGNGNAYNKNTCGRSSGSRPLLSSPGISFTSIDLSTLNVGNNLEGLDRRAADGSIDLSATAPPPPPLLRSAPLTAVASAEEDDSADLSESPSVSALQLSETEMRLLCAVMHVNQPGRAARTQISNLHAHHISGNNSSAGISLNDTVMSAPPAAMTATNTATFTTLDSGNGDIGLCALRESVRTFGDTRNEALSSGLRQFLTDRNHYHINNSKSNSAHPHESGDDSQTSSPLLFAPTLREYSNGINGGGSDCHSRLSESSSRVRVVSTPLSISAITRHSSRSKADGRAVRGSVVVASSNSNSTVTSAPLSLNSAEIPLKLTITRGSSRSSFFNSPQDLLSYPTDAIRGAWPGAFHAPVTFTTRCTRQNLKAASQNGNSDSAGLRYTPRVSLAKQALQPPPPSRMLSTHKRNVKEVDHDDSDDDVEPHLRPPLPTPRTSTNATKKMRRYSL